MNERQKRLIEVYEHLRKYYGIHTKTGFAEALHYGRTSMSAAMNGDEKYLTDKLFTKICEAYPDTFSLDYLLTGRGSLLDNNEKEPFTAPIDKQQDALTYAAIQVGKMMSDLSASISNVKRLEEQLQERETTLKLMQDTIASRLERLDNILASITKHENYRIPGMEAPQGQLAAEPDNDKKLKINTNVSPLRTKKL